jgi:uncharacterized Zn-finger protein
MNTEQKNSIGQEMKRSTQENIESAVPCPNCGLLFTTKFFMESHRKVKHPTNIGDFRCTCCPYATRYQHHLVMHENIHKAERPYVCEFCQQGFTQLGNLKCHEKALHTGKKIVCQTCGTHFVHRGNLNRHMMGHCHLKRLVCPLCGFLFLHATNFRKHMQEAHS